jgi:TM2 domain-containing membrane protein YozV
MASVAASVPYKSITAARRFSPLAAFLSYLFPGLGQIYQGRIAKGVLFFVCIYTLYFYGMYLGSGTRIIDGKTYHVSGNVYLPDTAERPGGKERDLPRWVSNIYNRPQFAGQFWIGVAAWPAIWQYATYPDEKKIQDTKDVLKKAEEEKAAAPGNQEAEQKLKKANEALDRVENGGFPFGSFQRTPHEEDLNAINVAGDKLIELGWVYTVIAGVLNIMVIYDAFAGPAFLAHAAPKKEGNA